MGSAKEHAIDLYMGAIRDGDARGALERNIGARYTQHSTGVKDGKEGFLEFFEPFLSRNPVRDMRIVRALQDGRHVFVHCFQSLNNGEARWVTGDFFDSDADGRIVEHWDVIAPFVEANAAGRSNIDGPEEITDHARTEENKALVQEFVTRVLIGGDVAAAAQFVGPAFAEHSADLADGVDGLLALVGPDAPRLRFDAIHLLVGEGNFVAVLSRAARDGADICRIDLFRVAEGRIVEHWDLDEPVPPRAEWANSGKF